MILDSTYWPMQNIYKADIAIIGAGAAGISLTLDLARRGKSVILLEGGDDMYTQESQDMYKGSFSARDLPYGMENSRLRYLGGSTNCWSGGCGQLDTEDFYAREWVPLSGWPISKSDLSPFYLKAAKFLGLDIMRLQNNGTLKELPKLKSFELGTLEYTKKVMFIDEFNENLNNDPNIQVLTGANFFELIRKNRSDVVEAIKIKSLNGDIATIYANDFVFAAGGIENARILLNTRDEQYGALGDGSGNLGRYFSDHPIAPCATLLGSHSKAKVSEYNVRGIKPNAKGQLALPFYRLPFNLQQKHKTLNVALQIHSQEDVLTDVEQAAWRLKKFYGDPSTYDIAFSDIVSVLKDPIRLYKTYKSRNNSKGRLALRFQIEQSPRYSNFISLNDETDLIGLKKANLHWTFSEIERHTVDIAISYAAKAFQKINGGSLKLDPDMISDHRDLPQDLRGGQHHCGTTRMSNNSKHGVVDSNLKLFDADNVFVCGSSVFPTNGWVNPTFTIIALSFRLSKHLANRYR